MDQTNFINYKTVKEKFNYIYKGYNLKYIIPGYLNFVFDNRKITAKDTILAFLKSYEIFDLTKLLSLKCSILITFLIKRNDYLELAKATQLLFKDSEVVNIESLPYKKFMPFGLTYIKHFWLATYLIFAKKIGSNFITKLYYIALTIKIFNLIKLVEKQKETTISKYICFNSAFREEAILTLFFQKRKIETISMQHGIFCDFKSRIPFDIINEENFIADKLLCWGQWTVDYLTQKLGIDRSRLILEGNPKYKNIEIGKINQDFKHCLVLLGRGYYLATNNKLLEVLTEFNQKHNNAIVFYIKKHPFLPDEEHREFANIEHNIIFLGKEHSTKDVLVSELVDFCIAVNTTAYYESLAMGKPCLRWTEEENEDFYGMDDKFENLHQLELKIDEFRNMSPETIHAQIKEVTKYVFNPYLQ